MKRYLLFLFVIFFTTHSFSQDSIYKFNDYYLNLRTLEKVQGIADKAKTFKDVSIYATRFNAPLWFELYPSVAYVKDRKIELKNNEIFISGKNDLTSDKKDTSFRYSGSSEDFLLSFPSVFVRIKKMPNKLIYAVLINDESGKNIKYIKLTHSMRIENENGTQEHPFLSFYTHTSKHIIFTSYNKDYPITELIDVNSVEQKTFDFSLAGIIRSDDDSAVIGFVEQLQERGKLKITMPKNTWETEIMNTSYNEFETLLKDTVLFIAGYSKIATGARLYAYHAQTGKLLWKGDVAQMEIAHSKYFNKVHLSFFENKIIMEGIEAGGKYLQIFDYATGKRLYTDGVKK